MRLNERNVNHKKLRAFKSLTRWRTFALITLHLSFLLAWPPRRAVAESVEGKEPFLPDVSLGSFLFFFSPPHFIFPLKFFRSYTFSPRCPFLSTFTHSFLSHTAFCFSILIQRTSTHFQMAKWLTR